MSFPLTPALSRREREKHPAVGGLLDALLPSALALFELPEAGGNTGVHSTRSRLALLFPLPKGEGQGVGKPTIGKYLLRDEAFVELGQTS
jgi:hypothetical protein